MAFDETRKVHKNDGFEFTGPAEIIDFQEIKRRLLKVGEYIINLIR
jgi:hypothetical protein